MYAIYWFQTKSWLWHSCKVQLEDLFPCHLTCLWNWIILTLFVYFGSSGCGFLFWIIICLSIFFPFLVSSVCPTTLTVWKASRNYSRVPLLESVSILSTVTSKPTHLTRPKHHAILFMCSRGQPRTNQKICGEVSHWAFQSPSIMQSSRPTSPPHLRSTVPCKGFRHLRTK